MNRFVRISFVFAPFFLLLGHAGPTDTPAVQAIDSGAIVSEGERIAKLLYDSFENMSSDVFKQIEVLGWCISPLQIVNDSQGSYVVGVLKGLLAHDEFKKLPSLYLDALAFVCSWLQSLDTKAKNSAIRVFLTLQELTWDAWGHNHAQELIAFGCSLSKALDDVSGVTEKQQGWLKILRTLIETHFPREKQLSKESKAWGDVVTHLCNQQSTKDAQQDILHGIAFCFNVHGRREPALQESANVVWRKVLDAISRLINECPKPTNVPSSGNKVIQPTTAANVRHNTKIQKSSRRVGKR
jgi:hypothetical protein